MRYQAANRKQIPLHNGTKRKITDNSFKFHYT